MECVEKDASAAAKFTCAPVHGHRKLCDCAFQPTIFLHLDILTVSHRFIRTSATLLIEATSTHPKMSPTKWGMLKPFRPVALRKGIHVRYCKRTALDHLHIITLFEQILLTASPDTLLIR